MVDGTQLDTERAEAPWADWPSADGARGHAPCRIDRWSPEGWTAVRHYADPALAETALTALRSREPEALLRLVRRTGDEGGADGPPRRALRPPAARRTSPMPAEPARLRRTAGALGLVALATLVCVARLTDAGERMSSPRSAGPATAAAPAAPGPESAEPGPLAGYWAHPGAGCGDAGDGIVFQSGRELRITADAVRVAPVAAYRIEAADGLQVEHADGGSLVLAAEAGGLRLLRARIADIAITPQEPWRLRLCPNRLPPLPGPAAARSEEHTSELQSR